MNPQRHGPIVKEKGMNNRPGNWGGEAGSFLEITFHLCPSHTRPPSLFWQGGKKEKEQWFEVINENKEQKRHKMGDRRREVHKESKREIHLLGEVSPNCRRTQVIFSMKWEFVIWQFKQHGYICIKISKFLVPFCEEKHPWATDETLSNKVQWKEANYFSWIWGI